MAAIQFYTTDKQEKQLLLIKSLAIDNNLPKGKVKLFELALNIAIDMINHLEDDDFQKITNLKKS